MNQHRLSTFSILRKYSDYSITSPTRIVANEKRIENLGKVPHFEEVDYSSNRRNSRAEMRAAHEARAMTELSPGQNSQTSDQSYKWGKLGTDSVRLSDHVVAGSYR